MAAATPTFQQLLEAQSQLSNEQNPAVRRALYRTVRQMQSILFFDGKEQTGLSVTARKILRKCGGQTMSIKSIALVCRMSPRSGWVYRAVTELEKNGQVTKVEKGIYKVSSANPTQK